MNPDEYLTSASGVRMPRIIYGTAWKKDRTAALVEQALTTGFRGIDTACQPKHYHEAGVGAGMAACLKHGLKRNELYLQTKFTSVGGQDPANIPYDASAGFKAQIEQSFQASLNNLQTDYLDCLVLHSPFANPKHTLEAWQTMEKLVAAGWVKQLGISNCYDPEQFKQLYLNATIKPAVIQNRFYAASGYDKEIREFCREHKIVYQSFWTLTANPNVLASNLLQTLAAKYHRSPEQFFFRYLSQIGIVPLTGTTSATHMRDDLAIFEFELDTEECAAIEALL
ncbi:MAG: aldo/keto reductase family protein [Methylobacter sp.]